MRGFLFFIKSPFLTRIECYFCSVKRIHLVILNLFFLFVCGSIIAQYAESKAGSYLIRNYSSKENGGSAQVLGLTQDKRGVMYFANTVGVLEYDGVSWNKILIGEEERKVLTLATNENGQVLVGAEGDFGILEGDSAGQIHFKSLLKETGIETIGDVGEILSFDESIVFRSADELIEIKEGKLLHRLTVDSKISCLSRVDWRVFVGQEGEPLYEFLDGELRPTLSGDFFADKRVMEVVRFNEKTIVVTEGDGLYELKENGDIIPLVSLEAYEITYAYVFNNLLSLGTFAHGLITLNTDFNIVYELGLDKGLADGTIKCQYIDREGSLWMGTNVGISKVSINEPILTYDKQVGLNSSIESIERYNGHLYFATQNGVYVLKNGVERVEGIEKDCYGVRAINIGGEELLFIAGRDDVFTLDKQGNVMVIENGGPYDIQVSPLDSNELIVLHYDGIAKLKYVNGTFEEVGYLTNFEGSDPYNFFIEEDGTIWVGTLDADYYGIFKGHVNMFEEDNPILEHFGKDEGLPKGASYLFPFEGDFYVGNKNGLFKFENNKFEVYNGFGFDFSGQEYGVHRINQDQEGNVWMVIYDRDNNYEFGFASKTVQGFEWNSLPFKRYTKEIIHSIYHESNGVTWLGGPGGLLRYDRSVKMDYHIPFTALIRSVNFGEDYLYNGTNYSDKGESISLAYSSNKSIGFEFAGTSFVDEENNLYSFYMEGHDDEWSEWSNRTVKEYNLSHGKYVFHVKAKDIYGNESSEATISIEVLPPWYQTIWAYSLYVVLFIVFVYGLIRLSIYRIRQKNIHLEKVVEERTQEVVVQKEEAEKQRDFAEQQKVIADQQKTLVEEKNREIVDSINYAKRIQDAIMPSMTAMEDALSNLFLLYIPKDVVAGDFFWMEKIDDVVYYAAADCTGHGVPGAMVSVVCSNALTKALLEDNIRDTGKLLDRTREIVIENLARSGEEVKDGMDISLCALNTKTRQLQWSGANNPLWILRNGAEEIEETKANKQPIGLFDRATPFTSHDLQLQEGDTIYVFTDGYQDQFGGPKGKKFKPMNVKRLFLENKDKSLAEQKEILHDTLVSWMRDLEQIDDICVIAVKV